MKAKIILGVTGLLALVLVGGGIFMNNAFAQGPGQGESPSNAAHDNQAVLVLLKSTEGELLQLRQEGKSWLDIAAVKGVTEAALLDAMLQSANRMHAQMAQSYPQFNATQMTEWMKTQLNQDLSVTQFGTMTDRHVLGSGDMMDCGNVNGLGGMMRGWGMMGNWNTGANGFGSMMRGWGMMGNWDTGANGFGGMMHGGGMMHNGGMMHGGDNLPNVTPEPVQ